MEDTLVSARISRAKKETGAAALRGIGSTASELINCAFDYVIATGKLPQTDDSVRRTMEDFTAFVRSTTLDVDWKNELADGDYREFMRRERKADYESPG